MNLWALLWITGLARDAGPGRQFPRGEITMGNSNNNRIIEITAIKDYDKLIAAACDAANRAGIDPALVCALCAVESNWNPLAMRYEPRFYDRYVAPISEKSLRSRNPWMAAGGLPTLDTERRLLSFSYGLMQVMGQTARENGFDGQWLGALLIPSENLEIGCRYLSRKLTAWSEVDDAISAYNAGSPTGRNAEYVGRVLSWRDAYQERFSKP